MNRMLPYYVVLSQSHCPPSFIEQGIEYYVFYVTDDKLRNNKKINCD